jgi:ABC-2 type transport system permease protein
MNLKRTGILLRKEILQGNKGFLFIMAIIGPIMISLVISLVFGTLINDTPRLGILDEGDSRVMDLAAGYSSMITTEYGTDTELRQAVESGAASLGLVLPPGFDRAVAEAGETDITVYIWGEGTMEHFEILDINIVNMVYELSGAEAPVNIETISLGGGAGVPWNDRLLPFIVLYTVVLAAILLPAMAVITEKEKKTITALAATPTTLGEIFVSKGVIGAVLSLLMGIVILLINQAFGVQPWLLVLVLGLGAVMVSIIGLLAGAFLKDITSLLAFSKIGGFVLIAPGFVYMFPQIPQWLGYIFPTYYIVEPIVELSQRGGGWPDIALNVFILVGLIVLLSVILAIVLRKKAEQQLAF